MYITKQKQTHREQTSGCQWGEGKGGEARQEYEIKRYKLLCVR